jgi:Zn-dependent protease
VSAERTGSSPLVHAALFLATVITTTAQGAYNAHGEAGTIFPIADGLSYSLPLMAILVAHEFGHYFVARLHGVPASLPYFVPLPPGIFLLGTMGAVIRMSEVTANRKKLIDIGAAGPLAGLIVAVPVLLHGLSLSEVQVTSTGALQEGNSLLYAGLKYLVKGQWLPAASGMDVNLHPTAFAGWAGLLVTMLNLLPFGQLDGGHIAVAYGGNGYRRIAPRFHKLLLFLAAGVFAWVFFVVHRALGGGEYARVAALRGFTPANIAVGAAMPWVFWYALVRLMRSLSRGEDHPPVEERPLPRSRVALFWVMLVVFVVTFMPVLLRVSVAPADAPGKTPVQGVLADVRAKGVFKVRLGLEGGDRP